MIFSITTIYIGFTERSTSFLYCAEFWHFCSHASISSAKYRFMVPPEESKAGAEKGVSDSK